MTPVRIIYITGAGRSGTTILDRVLGTLDGVTSLNEIHRVWKNGFVENQFCSCGNRFGECPFWQAVVREAFPHGVDVARVLRLQERLDRSRWFFRTRGGRGGRFLSPESVEYAGYLERLYRAISKAVGGDCIVDSSKVPTRALLLGQIPGFHVEVIHLVRDVRACVYAWLKEWQNPATHDAMTRYSPTRTTVFWMVRNLLSERLGRDLPYQRLRYEDFGRDPRRALQTLAAPAGSLLRPEFPFTGERTIELPPLHTMAGNPHRFQTGLTTLRLDEDWVTRLPGATRRYATMLAYPLLRRYGYAA